MSGNQWVELWREYEAQKTLEAKVVKHLDKFDMIAQAFDYERKYSESQMNSSNLLQS